MKWLANIFSDDYFDSSYKALSNYIYIMGIKLMYCVKGKKLIMTYLSTGNKRHHYFKYWLCEFDEHMRATVTLYDQS